MNVNSYSAKKYSVPQVERRCSEFLKQSLTNENAIAMLQQALLFENAPLVDLCFGVIDKGAVECLQSDSFVETPAETLQLVLRRDTLGVREVKLFEALVKWGVAQCNRQTLAPNPGNIRRVLGTTLDLVRFPLYEYTHYC